MHCVCQPKNRHHNNNNNNIKDETTTTWYNIIIILIIIIITALLLTLGSICSTNASGAEQMSDKCRQSSGRQSADIHVGWQRPIWADAPPTYQRK